MYYRQASFSGSKLHNTPQCLTWGWIDGGKKEHTSEGNMTTVFQSVQRVRRRRNLAIWGATPNSNAYKLPNTLCFQTMVKVKPCQYKRCISSILQLLVQTKRIVYKIDGLVRGFSIPAFSTKLRVYFEQNSCLFQVKSCVPLAQLLSALAYVAALWVGHLGVACFLDETNDSIFETTLDFVENGCLARPCQGAPERGSSAIQVGLSANCAIGLFPSRG